MIQLWRQLTRFCLCEQCLYRSQSLSCTDESVVSVCFSTCLPAIFSCYLTILWAAVDLIWETSYINTTGTNIHTKSCCLSSRDQWFWILWFQLFFTQVSVKWYALLFKSLGSCDIYLFFIYFWLSPFCSSRLYLLDPKHSKNVKYYSNVKQQFSMWISVIL